MDKSEIHIKLKKFILKVVCPLCPMNTGHVKFQCFNGELYDSCPNSITQDMKQKMIKL